MKIRALHNHIIFQFLDKIDARGRFIHETQSGFLIQGPREDDSAKSPRWAKVVCLGPDCTEDLRVANCEILIEPLQWTLGAKFEGQTYWKTDESKILATRVLEV